MSFCGKLVIFPERKNVFSEWCFSYLNSFESESESESESVSGHRFRFRLRFRFAGVEIKEAPFTK